MKPMAVCCLFFVLVSALSASEEGLVGRWNFDQDFSDSSGFENHLSNGGGVQLAPGRFGLAAAFDGTSNAFLSISGGGTTAVGDGDFSVSMWILPDPAIGNARLADHRGTGALGQYPGWQFRIKKTNGQWRFGGTAVDDGAGNHKSCGCGGNFDFGQWVHVVMIYEADTRIRVFVDGVQQGQKAVANLGSLDSGLPFTLGGTLVKKGVVKTTSSQRYMGLMDEVRLYHKALTDEEVQELFAMPVSHPEPPTTEMFVDFASEFAGASHSFGYFFLDMDSSGNGIPDFFLIGPDDDLDGDGLANRFDEDDDGDGIADTLDMAGYNVPTGSAAGFAPDLAGTMNPEAYKNGLQAAAAGLHAGDFWQFVPNGLFEQSGAPYTDDNGTSFAGVYQRPGAYLYIDRYDRMGAATPDGVPDVLQSPFGAGAVPPFVLDRNHSTADLQGGADVPGLLGIWPNSESTGETVFYLCDDDINTVTSFQYTNYLPYRDGSLPLYVDQSDAVDSQPDYFIYGTDDELDPNDLIPDSLKVDDNQGVRMWRYRWLGESVSDLREIVYFVTVYFNGGGQPTNTYYSRSDFNETAGVHYQTNAATSGDGFGVDPLDTGLGPATPNNWFPRFQNLSDHNLVAAYAFGSGTLWTDIASAPTDGSAPVALNPADQGWVDHFENFNPSRRVINYLSLAEMADALFVDLADLLNGRYDVLLDNEVTQIILRSDQGRLVHMASVTTETFPGINPTLLMWEDLYFGGDRNFVDLIMVTNRPPTTGFSLNP